MKPVKSGGVVLEQMKPPAIHNKIMQMPVPDTIAVPLYSFDRTSMLPIVRTGESLPKYAMLARSKAGSSWLFAPASGRLQKIERISHPLMGSVRCAYLRTDSGIPAVELKGHNPASMSRQGILQAIRQASIIDEVDGLPLHHKLQRALERNILLLVADCIDDAPYVSSALKTISEYGDRCADGVGLVLKLLGGGKAKLAVFDPGGLDMDAILDKFGFIDTVRLSGGYPAWFTFEKEYCGEKYIRIGVQALRAISRAVRNGLPQVDFITTVAGSAVSTPVNVQFTCGTSVRDILNAAGLRTQPKRIILGDTMTGASTDNLDLPLFPGIRSVIAMADEDERSKHSCIGCGRCVSVCPRRLFPAEVYRLYEQGRSDLAQQYGVKRCTGCGACSAACPSAIELTETMLSVREEAEANG